MSSHSTSSRSIRLATAVILAASVALSAAACNIDRATGAAVTAKPIVGPARGAVLSSNVTASVLTRVTPLAKDVTYQVDISGNGGMINVPEAGLQIMVPNGAFSGQKPVRFTVTAIAGDVVAYKFGPHGMKFNKPLSATQDLSMTTYGIGGSTTLESGYFPSDADLDVSGKSANVSEVFPGNVSTQNGSKVHFSIPHFSGYVIITGRKDFQ